jgi:predicted enzyme related to lactoylglutathione lyase
MMAKKKARKKAVKKKVVKKKAKKPAKKTTRTTANKAAKKKAAKKASKKTSSRKAVPKATVFPNNIGLVNQHVDFLTYKVEQVRKFYGDVLGFRTEQQEPNLNYLIVNVTPESSLGFMPPHPQMTGEQPPPREPTLYFVVKDVDKVFATLVAKGVAFMGPPQEMPWGHRVVMTTDPEGRTVMLGSPVKE